MKNILIRPCRLEGSVTVPPSKSQLHRILIARSLAGQTLPPPEAGESQDISATRRCLKALMRSGGEGLPALDCGESGSTLRFLIPLALALRGGAVFTGHGRLMERPLGPYFDLFREQGVRWELAGSQLTIEGRLSAGTYELPGDISSQFVTGLLLALPLVKGDSRIVLTTPLESRPYVDMTLAVLAGFGIEITEQENSFTVRGGQQYVPSDMEAEADWSQAAFWYAANFLGHHVDLPGLNLQSLQGDRQIGLWYWTLARPGDVELDLSQHPDLLPAAALMASVRIGTTRLVHAERLRLKESDRLTATARALTALGGQVEEQEDGLVVTGPAELTGGTVVDCAGDHRIAMMAAIAAAFCAEPVTLLGADCVAKSYPQFWDHYRSLGGDFDVLISG